MSAASEDIALAFEDWNLEVESIDTNITVVHGVQDKLFPVDMARRFAEAFPEKVKLIEIKDAGMPLLQSHTSVMIKLLKSAVEVQKPEMKKNTIDKLITAQIPVFTDSETPQH